MNQTDKGAKYMPTPDEIALGCHKARQRWTATTEQQRLRYDWRQPTAELRVETKTIAIAEGKDVANYF